MGSVRMIRGAGGRGAKEGEVCPPERLLELRCQPTTKSSILQLFPIAGRLIYGELPVP